MKHHMRIVTAQGTDGRQYSLYIYYNEAASSGTRPAVRSATVGNIELATSDGQLVRWRARGLYEIVATGVILRSSALDAP
jgi:hypothetical protein